jgi:hypothetical protein
MFTTMPNGSNNEVAVSISLPDEYSGDYDDEDWRDDRQTARGNGKPILDIHYKNHGEGVYTIYSANELSRALQHLYKHESENENSRREAEEQERLDKEEREEKRRKALGVS